MKNGLLVRLNADATPQVLKMTAVGTSAKMRGPKRELYQIAFGDWVLIYFERSDLIVHEGYAVIRSLMAGYLGGIACSH